MEGENTDKPHACAVFESISAVHMRGVCVRDRIGNPENCEAAEGHEDEENPCAGYGDESGCQRSMFRALCEYTELRMEM